MCGIVGYIGKQDVVPILVAGLERLEYRGYDSAGIAILSDNSLKLAKKQGRLAQLQKELQSNILEGTIGIGHTRWATHGAPSDVNAHPHVSSQGSFAVVHNGIIENYIELKAFLESKGIQCISDTDTEIVVNLIEYYYQGDFAQAVVEAVNKLEGSYALGAICKDCDNMLIAARKDSPLVVGLGEGENFIASDIAPLLKYTKKMYILEDGEFVAINRDGVIVFDINQNKIEKTIFSADWDIEAAERGGYEHFMLKEIFEEPKALRDTINPRIKNNEVNIQGIDVTPELLSSINKICIIACGTAYHAGVVGKYVMENLIRIPVDVEIASEFRYKNPLIDEKTLAIVISQSGETLDTLSAMREAKKRGAKVIAIVNIVSSSIAREVQQVMYTWAGPEISVASTKAYNTQLAALYLLAIDWASKLGKIDKEKEKSLIDEIKQVPEMLEGILDTVMKQIQSCAQKYQDSKEVFYIGRNLDYALAMEGSLKLKEISYIHSEAYPGGELKHGTIALIEDGTLVICLLTQNALLDKMISNIKEVKARGARVLAITQHDNAVVREVADDVIFIPNVLPMVAPIVAVTPLQLMAYFMAVGAGRDVDKPRNLAKSVTVE